MAAGPKQRETRTLEQSQSGRVRSATDDGLDDSQGLAVFGLLGSGGMGAVHEGRQLGLGRAVALKSVLGEATIEKQRDLVREGQVMALLEHPNIVPVYTLRHVEGKPVIVLKKIVGDRWSDRMKQEDMAWNVSVLLKVADAVRFAHSKGILHRDLKPSNVMIGQFGEVYVLDWGSAVSTREEHRGKVPLATSVFKPFGSAPYMSPEMLNPAWATIAETTDVYLLGAILYEIVMGAPPHLAKSAQEMYRNVERSRPRYRKEIPTELVAILQQAMRREPRQRFQSVDALQEALVEFMKHRASHEMMLRGTLLLEGLRGATQSSSASSVYDIFQRCKFAFNEALRTWPENVRARELLGECGAIVADFELSRGEPALAARLLQESGVEGGTRSARIAQALRRKRRLAAHAAYLRRDLDVHLASEMRRVVMVGIGLLWVVVPLWLFVGLEQTSYRSQSASHAGFLFICGVITLVTKGWVDSSASNRALFKIVLCGAFSAVAINWGSWSMGLPPHHAQVYHLFVFLVCALSTTVHVDWRAWPAMLGFLVAFLVAARSPAYCLPAMSAANAVLAANAFVIWGGTGPKPTVDDAVTEGLAESLALPIARG